MTRNEQTSYIFAKCKGERAHTISQIQRIPNVESCTPVTGRFDLVIKLRTNEPTKAFTTMEKIRSIPSITNTQTTISFESIINSSNRGDNDSALAFALLKVRGSFDAILRKLKTIPNFAEAQDRKSTRLNSSHSQISYAVFCLKKQTATRRRRAASRRTTLMA